MRPWVTAACLALCIGAIDFSQALCSAQEQSEGKRKIVSRVAPTYPELARKLQILGRVKVEVVIAPSGKVASMRVLGGNPLLAKSAVDAIELWKWEAAPQETKELVELSFHP
jgi:TonB family protein